MSSQTTERIYDDSPKPMPDFWEANYTAHSRRNESNLARAYIELYNFVDQLSKRREQVAFHAEALIHAKR